MDLRECVNPECDYDGQSDDKKHESCESHLDVASPSPGAVTETSSTLPRYEDSVTPKAEFVSEVTDYAMGHSSVAPASATSTNKTIASPTTDNMSPACQPTETRDVEAFSVPSNTSIDVPRDMPTTTFPGTTPRREVNNARECKVSDCLVVVILIVVLVISFWVGLSIAWFIDWLTSKH